jgi:hypothetical protein
VRTRLVGEGFSRIILADHAVGYGDSRAPKAVLETPDVANGRVQIAGIRVTSGAGNLGAVLVDWRVGGGLRNSLHDVNLPVGSSDAASAEGGGGLGEQLHGQVHTLLWIRGNGSIYASNCHLWGTDHSVVDNSFRPDAHALHGMVISGAGPVLTVGVASEHHYLTAFELRATSDVTFLGLQTEQTNRSLVVADSERVTIHGTVITCSPNSRGWKSCSEALVRTRNVSDLEIYGLNTLNPTNLSKEMLEDEGQRSMNVPLLASGDELKQFCRIGDCAMVVRTNSTAPLEATAAVAAAASTSTDEPRPYDILWNSPWPAECADNPPPRGGDDPSKSVDPLPDWISFGIHTNNGSQADYNGETVATLYAPDTGLYPQIIGSCGPEGPHTDYNCSIGPDGTPRTMVNGGIPQLLNMSAHLDKWAADIVRILPDPSWSGVVLENPTPFSNRKTCP